MVLIGYILNSLNQVDGYLKNLQNTEVGAKRNKNLEGTNILSSWAIRLINSNFHSLLEYPWPDEL